MNHEDFCSYELSKKLAEKGFDWECDYVYRNYGNNVIEADYLHIICNLPILCLAPTLSQAQKWLREKGIAINVIAHDGGFYQWEEIYLPNAPEYECFIEVDTVQYSTYEQSLSAGITKALELI